MNNRTLLKQKREGFKAVINIDPQALTFYRAKLVDNGFGEMVPDPTGALLERSNTVRLSHPSGDRGPFQYGDSSVGVIPPSGRFLQALYDADIEEGDTVSSYKVGPVDELRAYGGVFGKQAILISAESVEA